MVYRKSSREKVLERRFYLDFYIVIYKNISMAKLQKGGQLYVKKSNIKGARVRI